MNTQLVRGNDPYAKTKSPIVAAQFGPSPALEAKAILRKHSTWRGRIRPRLPFSGVTIYWLRAARFILLLGPWRSLAVAVLRYKFRSRTFPRISPTMFPSLDVDAASKALDRDGFAGGLQLPLSSINEITEFAVKACKVEEPHWDCVEINRIAHDIAIVEVAKRYLGAEPILHSTTLLWTLPTKPFNRGAETFHYEVADFKSVCVWFYLTDVSLDCAPHVAIAGTHKANLLFRLFNPSMSDEYAAQRFGSRVITFSGEAGLGFFEDQATLHKRLRGARPRAAFCVIYTLRRKPDVVRDSSEVIPWARSTGPTTPAGKARVARNGHRGGTRPALRLLARALRARRLQQP